MLWLPVTLTYGVRPDRPDAHDVVLDWFETAAEGDEPLDVAALEDDAAVRAAVEAAAIASPRARASSTTWRSSSRTSRAAQLPAGYRLSQVDDSTLASRVGAHCSAFHPSRDGRELPHGDLGRRPTGRISTSWRSLPTAPLPRTRSAGSTT